MRVWALRYFDDVRIDQVTENKLEEYIEWRFSQPRRPAVGTLRNERSSLRQLFGFAKRKGYINEIPELRIKSSRPNARPDIPDAEWKRLCDYLPLFVDKAQDRRRQRERCYLVLYILILANTGIRIGEARKLQWRDVSSTRTLTGETRAILTVRGKTGERETVCNIGVDRFLAELKSFRTAELGRIPSDAEHLFCRAPRTMTFYVRREPALRDEHRFEA